MFRRLSSIVDRRVMGWVLVVAGLGIIALWLLYPWAATIVANNLGSVLLNRALLTPDLAPEQRTAQAIKAGQTFQNALAWDPLNGQAYYNLAAIYTFWQDGSSANLALSRAAASNPGDACARFKFGQALAQMGQEAAAIEAWHAADAAPYFINQGARLLGEGNDAEAIKAYERAIAIAPESSEAYLQLGRALNRAGRSEEAIEALEKAAVRESPRSSQRYLLQAEVHVAREEWTKAMESFQRASVLDPRDPEPHYRMGQLWNQRLENQEAAIRHYQWALYLTPDHVPSRLALAELYDAQGDCDKAARWLDPFFASNARKSLQTKAHVLLGRCLSRQERTNQALSHLEEVVLLNPKSARHHLTLAQAYSQAGRYQAAIQTYLQVLELQPDNAQAKEALKELGWSE
jgi:tetratricopeptide (TPR) repeat protein